MSLPPFILKTRTKTRTEAGNDFLYNSKTNSNIHKKSIINFFSSKIVQNAEITTAEKGLYTWILRSSGNFYSIKTISKQEVGSLHINLKMLTDSEDPSDIYAAGELELGSSVQFNLLSGTYMVPKFKKISNSKKLLYRNEIAQTVIQTLKGFGISSQFLECSNISKCDEEEQIGGMKLIEKTNIRTSESNLVNLNRLFNRKYGGYTNRRRMKKLTMTRKTRMY